MSDTFESFVTSLDGDAIDHPESPEAAAGTTANGKPRRQHKGNVKGTKLHPQPITASEAELLLKACGRGSRAIRNRAIIAILYRGMLRSNELVHLRVADVNVDSAEIRVLMGKGRQARTVALDPKAMRFVKKWLARREKLQLPPAGTLFVALQGVTRGRKLETGYLRGFLRRAGKRAGIGKRLHPHGLRHSGACEMRKAGIDIGIISKALGHKSIATTARYLDHISPTDVLAAMRGMKW